MLSLAQINNSNAYMFSDLYKDVYGFRPREVYFQSEEAFTQQFNNMCIQLDQQLQNEKADQEQNWNTFLDQIDELADIMVNSSDEDIVRIIADAEGVDLAYGWEALEYHFNIKYGSIKQFLNH